MKWKRDIGLLHCKQILCHLSHQGSPWLSVKAGKLEIKLLAFVGSQRKPFGYDQNQIPFDYAVEETTRFKGLDLVNKVPEELWSEVPNIGWEAVTKTILKKNKYKRAKQLSEEALQSPLDLTLQDVWL